MAAWERKTVLLIQPDDSTARELAAELTTRYRVAIVGTAAAAREWLSSAAPDAVVLELALPDADGLIFCAHLRSRTTAPLLVYTVQSGSRELLLSLRLGADDFVAKPAMPGEIEARIGALLRRADAASRARGRMPARPTSGPDAQPPFHPSLQWIGDLAIDREGLSVTVSGKPLYLTASEYRLLLVLARHLNDPVSRVDLARLSGGPEYLAGSRSLDMHVRRLRAKLRAARGKVPGIVPVRGFGYRMVHAGGEEVAPPAA